MENQHLGISYHSVWVADTQDKDSLELGFDPGASQPLVQDLGIRKRREKRKSLRLLPPWRRLAPRLRGREQEAHFILHSVGPRKNDGQPWGPPFLSSLVFTLSSGSLIPLLLSEVTSSLTKKNATNATLTR